MSQSVNRRCARGLDQPARRRRGRHRPTIKPKLRGWLHLATAPLTLAAGIVLIALSPDATTRIGSAVFTGTALVLFTVSAIYHTGTWSPRTWAFLRRFDHANIFLLIAGSYTPFSLLLLDGTTRWVLLATVWAGAILGRAVPDLLDRRPALALRAALHRDGLGRGLLPARRSSTAPPRLGVGDRRRDVHDDRGRRRALHLRRRRLRLQAPQPVAALVRLPRGLPHLHDPRVRRALRRRLAGDVLPALSRLIPELEPVPIVCGCPAPRTAVLRAPRDLLAANLADGTEAGASLAVVHDGELVVDLWGGEARPGEPWARGHARPGLVGHQDDGRAHHAGAGRPRRARPGRAGRVVLAGVPPRRRAGAAPARAHLGLRRLDRDPRRRRAARPRARPSGCWPSRSRGGSRARRRATTWSATATCSTGWSAAPPARPLADQFRTLVAEPLGADFHLGVPDDALRRCADLVAAAAGRARPRRCCPRATCWCRRSSTRCSTSAASATPPPWRRVSVAGANGHGNARVDRPRPVGGLARRRGRRRPPALARDDRPDLRGPGRRPRPGAAACRCAGASATGCRTPHPRRRCPTGGSAGGPGTAARSSSTTWTAAPPSPTR